MRNRHRWKHWHHYLQNFRYQFVGRKDFHLHPWSLYICIRQLASPVLVQTNLSNSAFLGLLWSDIVLPHSDKNFKWSPGTEYKSNRVPWICNCPWSRSTTQSARLITLGRWVIIIVVLPLQQGRSSIMALSLYHCVLKMELLLTWWSVLAIMFQKVSSIKRYYF